jgi:phage gp29-like protein
MSLSPQDLTAIKNVVDESINHAIETKVPPMIEHLVNRAIETKVPPMIERAIDNLSLQIGRGFNEVTENFKVVYQRLDRLEALTPNRH